MATMIVPTKGRRLTMSPTVGSSGLLERLLRVADTKAGRDLDLHLNAYFVTGPMTGCLTDGTLPIGQFLTQEELAHDRGCAIQLVESSYGVTTTYSNSVSLIMTGTMTARAACIAIGASWNPTTSADAEAVDRHEESLVWMGVVGNTSIQFAPWAETHVPISYLQLDLGAAYVPPPTVEPPDGLYVGPHPPIPPWSIKTSDTVVTSTTNPYGEWHGPTVSTTSTPPVWASFKPPISGYDVYRTPREVINWYPNEGDYRRGDLQINEPEGKGYHDLEFWVCVHTESPKHRTDPAWVKVHTVTASDLAGAAKPEDIQNFITKKAIEVLELHPR